MTGMTRARHPALRQAGRLLALVLLCLLSMQLVFVGRIALMAVVDPQSTTFQRSEAWRLLSQQQRILWSQQWVDSAALSANLKRAVIASEDAGFVEHPGVDWDALERAWEKNRRVQARADRAGLVGTPRPGARAPKVVGGSTITQQLAKNLLLSGERTVSRKAQEMLLTVMLETLLSKQRILEIYLNNVEWGEGIFGAQAAARHYFRVDAARLSPEQAARLAVMLPRPRYFEKLHNSGYLASRASTIVARMRAAELP